MVEFCKNRILLLLLTFLLYPMTSFSQEKEDFGARLGVDVSKRFWKRLDVGLSEEFRLKNNCHDMGRWSNGVDVSYTILKRVFKVGAGYDLIGEWNEYDEYFDFKHRFNGYFSLKHSINRFSCSWKSRYQITYKNEDYGRYKWNPKNYCRNKVNVSYDIPRLTLEPYVSFECFFQTNNYKGNVVDRLRYEVGFEYEFDKHNSIDLNCRYNMGVNVNKPERQCQVGVFYHYKF